MFFTEGSSENNDYMLYRVEDNVKNNLEYYYHANLILTVFAVGAFSLYIATGISRGIFLLLDLFLIYKACRRFLVTRKMKSALDSIRENLKYIKGLLVFDTILLTEAIVRHFLDLNITILDYLWIVAIAYSSVCIVYRVIKKVNGDRYYNSISENRYEDVIRLKAKKEKIFTFTTLILIIFLIIAKFMEIFSTGELAAVMTVIYSLVLLFNLDISTEVSIEYGLLVKGKINDIERVTVEDNEEYYDENNKLNENENSNVESEEIYKNKEVINNSELEKTAAYSNDFISAVKEDETEEEVIKSRVERNKKNKSSIFKPLENLEYEKYLNKVKALRKRIDRDK